MKFLIEPCCPEFEKLVSLNPTYKVLNALSKTKGNCLFCQEEIKLLVTNKVKKGDY